MCQKKKYFTTVILFRLKIAKLSFEKNSSRPTSILPILSIITINIGFLILFLLIFLVIY